MRVLPRFEIVARRRPVGMLVPGPAWSGAVAPYVAVEAAGDGELALASGDVTLTATYDRTVTCLLYTSPSPRDS